MEYKLKQVLDTQSTLPTPCLPKCRINRLTSDHCLHNLVVPSLSCLWSASAAWHAHSIMSIVDKNGTQHESPRTPTYPVQSRVPKLVRRVEVNAILRSILEDQLYLLENMYVRHNANLNQSEDARIANIPWTWCYILQEAMSSPRTCQRHKRPSKTNLINAVVPRGFK